MEHFDSFEQFRNSNIDFYKLVGDNLKNIIEEFHEYVDQKEIAKRIEDVEEKYNFDQFGYEQAKELIQGELDAQEKFYNKAELKEARIYFENSFDPLLFLTLGIPLDHRKLEKREKDLLGSLKEFFNPKKIDQRKKIITKISKTLVGKKEDKKAVEALWNKVESTYKRWEDFVEKQEDRYIVKNLREIKPDDQQKELEGKYHKEVIRKKKKIEANEKPSTIKKIAFATTIAGFSDEWIRKFDQPGLENSGKLMDEKFLKVFKNIEDLYGTELYVTSGIRTQEYQDELRKRGYNAAKKSTHVEGVAADVSLENIDVEKLKKAVLDSGVTRIGTGKSFMHLDLGDMIKPKIWRPFARWNYNY